MATISCDTNSSSPGLRASDGSNREGRPPESCGRNEGGKPYGKRSLMLVSIPTESG